MKKVRILSLLLVLVMLLSFTLTACIKPDTGDGKDPGDDSSTPNTPAGFDLPYAEGTILRMATGYNFTKTGLSFHADIFRSEPLSVSQ